MNLHVLFCATDTVGPDGASFPIASLSLSLDDEVQYRCAGFIQAEIERYAEELDESDHKGSDINETSESEDEEATTAIGKKGKKLTKDDEFPGTYLFPNCSIVLKVFLLRQHEAIPIQSRARIPIHKCHFDLPTRHQGWCYTCSAWGCPPR